MSDTLSFPKVAQLKRVEQLSQHAAELGISLPLDEKILTAEQGSPLAQPIKVGDFKVGNRWCIHPMEGWDANLDGSPSKRTLRRWKRFGQSGA
ncbi:MAG: NADH:flavin oxidoreductase, partial [Lacipirellulaceae bacterium]